LTYGHPQQTTHLPRSSTLSRIEFGFCRPDCDKGLRNLLLETVVLSTLWLLVERSFGHLAYVRGMIYHASRRSSYEDCHVGMRGVTPTNVTSLNPDKWLVGHCKILAWQWAKPPRYRREGAVEVRPFPAKKRPRVSEAQGLPAEAMKRNPTTTVIPGVDESKSSPRTNRRLDRTETVEILGRGLC